VPIPHAVLSADRVGADTGVSGTLVACPASARAEQRAARVEPFANRKVTLLTDAARNLLVTGLMIAAGAAIGFRFHAGPAAAQPGHLNGDASLLKGLPYGALGDRLAEFLLAHRDRPLAGVPALLE
jgi:hypothetical protein